MDRLIDLVYRPFDTSWGKAASEALSSLFDGGRYGKRAAGKVQLRINAAEKPGNVPFAALIEQGQPDQGPYGGMSFVLFPTVEPGTALVSLVIGTNGLQPDEEILSRPGHARKVAAICRWLNNTEKRRAAWAKRDPVRIDLDLPKTVATEFANTNQPLKDVFEKYGRVIYAMYTPEVPRSQPARSLASALEAFLDLLFEERGQQPVAAFRSSYEENRAAWLAMALPDVSEDEVAELLGLRRYVVIEGPPGTGKTRLAENLLKKRYSGRGLSIQFHPSTTYESFIGGLSPVTDLGETGLRFIPKPGELMNAAGRALAHPDESFLLHIDEINRADLSKVLGEAIFLFEPRENRTIHLVHDFGEPFHQEFRLPSNLHILGTMNSADRSIAILDLAIRRRFSFTQLWPQSTVVRSEGGAISREAYDRLLSIFLEHASDEAFDLMPGHGYFLASDPEARKVLGTGVAPLLREYLRQGYVSGFSDEIHAYLDWLETQ